MISAVLLAATLAPFGVAVTPAHVQMPPNSYTMITVADTGTAPVHIGATVKLLRPVTGHPGAWVTGPDVTYARVAPGGFDLAPGQSRQVRVDVLPSAAPWHRDLAVAVLASQAGGSGGARAAISAGADAHLVIPGKARPQAGYVYHAPPVAPGHSAPVALLAVIFAALASAAGVSWRVIRRRRRGAAAA